MVLLVDIVQIVQTFGIALGIGAQSVMLAAFIQAIRDGVIDQQEAQFVRAVRWILKTGLLLIIFSGVASIFLDVTQGNAAVFSEPIYLFKWMLIGIVLLFGFAPVQKLTIEGVSEGIAGGSWYVLFLVHLYHPVTSWANLLTLYAVWMVGFTLCWWALVLLCMGKKQEAPKKIDIMASALPPKFVAPPPVKPALPNLSPVKPAVPTPPPAPKPATPVAPVPVVPPKPEVKITDPDKNPGLPAIQVMPKTQEDIATQNRASFVKFD